VTLSSTTWWVVGYAVGAAVVVVAASLLLAIIVLARRIARQAREIEAALVGAREHTDSLFELSRMNHAIESLARDAKRVRGQQGVEDERGLLGRVRSVVARLAP